MPNQDAAFASPFGNGPVRVGTQGRFRPCLKTFVAPFLLARLTASLCFLKIYITRKNVTTVDSRKQGCVITIVLEFNNNNALIVNHSICTHSQDAIWYSLSVISHSESGKDNNLNINAWEVAQSQNFKNAGFSVVKVPILFLFCI